MNNIPNEIIREILSRLPVKAVLCCKCVSKSWLEVITDPRFIESHLRRSYADANNYHELHTHNLYGRSSAGRSIAESVHVTVPVDFVPPSLRSKHDRRVRSFIASHNGLLLFTTNFTGPPWIKHKSSVIHLCNPSMKQCREYPNSFYRYDPYRSETTLGFGACPSISVDIRDYKVVKLSIGLKRESALEVEVYSFRANSWRLITDSIDPRIRIDISRQPQVLLNESLNWLAVRGKRHIVVAFNMADEVYEEMELPFTEEDSTSVRHLFLWMLEGCLALFRTYRPNSGGSYWDVFVMKKYGKIDSWVHVYTLDITGEFPHLYSSVPVWTVPVWTMPSGELVLKTIVSVHLYDHKSKRIKKVGDRFIEGAYVESLITLIPGSDLQDGESVAQPPQLDRKLKKNAERKGEGCSSSSATKKRRSSIVKCSACKYLGHNKRTCHLRDKMPGN